mgnify:CR=1
MPYKSKAQAAKFHILKKQGKLSERTVAEWDKASIGLSLPEKVGSKKVRTVRTTRTITEKGKR